MKSEDEVTRVLKSGVWPRLTLDTFLCCEDTRQRKSAPYRWLSGTDAYPGVVQINPDPRPSWAVEANPEAGDRSDVILYRSIDIPCWGSVIISAAQRRGCDPCLTGVHVLAAPGLVVDCLSKAGGSVAGVHPWHWRTHSAVALRRVNAVLPAIVATWYYREERTGEGRVPELEALIEDYTFTGSVAHRRLSTGLDLTDMSTY